MSAAEEAGLSEPSPKVFMVEQAQWLSLLATAVSTAYKAWPGNADTRETAVRDALAHEVSHANRLASAGGTTQEDQMSAQAAIAAYFAVVLGAARQSSLFRLAHGRLRENPILPHRAEGKFANAGAMILGMLHKESPADDEEIASEVQVTVEEELARLQWLAPSMMTHTSRAVYEVSLLGYGFGGTLARPEFGFEERFRSAINRYTDRPDTTPQN